MKTLRKSEILVVVREHTWRLNKTYFLGWFSSYLYGPEANLEKSASVFSRRDCFRNSCEARKGTRFKGKSSKLWAWPKRGKPGRLQLEGNLTVPAFPMLLTVVAVDKAVAQTDLSDWSNLQARRCSTACSCLCTKRWQNKCVVSSLGELWEWVGRLDGDCKTVEGGQLWVWGRN